MHKPLALLLVAGLLVGGAAACSDDDDAKGGDATSTTAADGASGDGASDGGDAAGEGADTADDPVVAANDAVIQEYCDAKDANDEAQAAYTASPGDKALEDAAIAASGRAGEASDAVAPVVETFTPEQAAQFEECSG